ncbi:bacteriocin-like protein [Chryseobacterium muglaense]|uniref:bacteriocin-like protein n=1 Tax=Chryseobacterium muglaense TaxID=2893752 RepID=UPI003D80E57A
MKNLKKISRKELKSISGGIQTCDPICMTGYYRCCIPRQAYYCAPNGSQCGNIIIIQP